MGEIEVCKITEGDIPILAERMGRAFAPQPLTRWLLGPRNRCERAARLMALEMRRALPYGLSFSTSGRKGAAIWYPPERNVNIWQDALWALRAGAVVGVGLRSFAQMYAGLRLLLAEPHEKMYYLSLLAVAPEWQGQGTGSALLKPMLARIDAEGMPAYLSTDTQGARRLYERHGFQVQYEIDVPGGGFLIDVMVRKSGGAGR